MGERAAPRAGELRPASSAPPATHPSPPLQTRGVAPVATPWHTEERPGPRFIFIFHSGKGKTTILALRRNRLVRDAFLACSGNEPRAETLKSPAPRPRPPGEVGRRGPRCNAWPALDVSEFAGGPVALQAAASRCKALGPGLWPHASHRGLSPAHEEPSGPAAGPSVVLALPGWARGAQGPWPRWQTGDAAGLRGQGNERTTSN